MIWHKAVTNNIYRICFLKFGYSIHKKTIITFLPKNFLLRNATIINMIENRRCDFRYSHAIIMATKYKKNLRKRLKIGTEY
jgi:hypothetical protein